ncbi:hypothetical protein PPL_07599 [Heterostelium album PN500]|uniref:Amine oxidase domain-containing protein n=1 Tax=Heterostelium pallidum (strain ATCC 26659 / Pp 5 / PN500) TaxID=670386 RepID=D3BGE8_HETP5|nr:hypothetical protein PPL_07599 [Heterostelium album PN500]EFA79548.1 hypothetical protein PPL_07599 [Heterostelium album PN500]|eukprot:XP_020431669.1 hypothetical protein PPL_07599 [Heterostelium album PN500]
MKIAVVGGGISGMSSAYLLTKGGHQVTVFEKGDYLGGHTNTVDATFEGVGTVKADTGFLVYNEEHYPNLMRLFRELAIESADSDVSFAFSLNARGNSYANNGADQQAPVRNEVEWGSDGASTVFAQLGNLFRPKFWCMLRDMVRFHKEAPLTMLEPEKYKNITIAEYMATNNYSEAFKCYYLVPVMSALWSTSFAVIDHFPILTLVRFFANHDMLRIFGRPQWKTVKGGSYQYMERLAEYLENNGSEVRMSTAVTRVVRYDDHVEIVTADSPTPESFDAVVMACHPPETLNIVDSLTKKEHEVLSVFKYTPHTVYLHSDPILMPKRRNIWAAWNYLYDDRSSSEHAVCVTYWINRIQPWLDREKTPLYVTLNPIVQPQQHLVHKVIQYEHPLYTAENESNQEYVTSIQGIRRTYYCGAYYGFGFHEDGITSGLLAAQQIDPELKKIWEVDMKRYEEVPVANQKQNDNNNNNNNKQNSNSLLAFNKLASVAGLVFIGSMYYFKKDLQFLSPFINKIDKLLCCSYFLFKLF